MSNSTSCPVGKAEKLLLATDGSEFSEGAIREAIKFAAQCSSKLYAMSVIEILVESEAFPPQKIEDLREAEAKKHLEAVRSRALKEKVDCEIIISHGDPEQEIIEEAARRGVDMVIVGRRGTRRIERLLMGEVAAKVIGQVRCKVLVVPRAAVIGYKNILVATDGSGHSMAAVEEATKIAKKCGSRLLIISAARDGSELQEAETNAVIAAELAKKEGVSAETLTPVGRSYDVIVETAGGRGMDLIVMGTFGKSGIRKMLMGSSTEKVIGKAGCAVLIVKGKESPATV